MVEEHWGRSVEPAMLLAIGNRSGVDCRTTTSASWTEAFGYVQSNPFVKQRLQQGYPRSQRRLLLTQELHDFFRVDDM